MALDALKDNVVDVQENAKLYVETSIAYYKLWGFKVAMKSTAMILKFTLILLFFSMALLFFSVAAAFAIGKYLNSYTLGFLIVAGVYLVFSGLLLLIKDKIMEKSILEKFSEIFFND